MAADWFDELELDPDAHPVSMGTRSLGDRPWLIADHKREAELAYKHGLMRDRRAEVSWLTPASVEPATNLAAVLGIDLAGDAHPLEQVARVIQEDVCLVRRDSAGHWVLDASVVCFPSYWKLADKVGRSMAAVHGPVDSYDPLIVDKVDRLFDRLTERPVWRRNWNLTDDRELFHPQRRLLDPAVPSDRVMADLLVRSERQVLRALSGDWLVFTIRVQIESVGDLLGCPGSAGVRAARIDKLLTYAMGVTADLAQRRHLGEEQRRTLIEALDG